MAAIGFSGVRLGVRSCDLLFRNCASVDLVVQDNTQEGIVDVDFAVVLDEA